MTEAARLVDELTTLLYEVIKRWQLQDGRVCEIVRCGACRRKADRAESVVHKYDCPVYRLIRAEEANTAVIRANADEIADLEDRRDELEGRVNALTAEMECRNELSREVARLTALLAERDAAVVRTERVENARMIGCIEDYDPTEGWIDADWRRYEWDVATARACSVAKSGQFPNIQALLDGLIASGWQDDYARRVVVQALADGYLLIGAGGVSVSESAPLDDGHQEREGAGRDGE